MDKRCGNCRWWEAWHDPGDNGDCEAPTPASVPVSQLGRMYMREDEGTDCPVWEGREGE